MSRQLGIVTTAVITEMENPLGKVVGNALEVKTYSTRGIVQRCQASLILYIFKIDELTIYIYHYHLYYLTSFRFMDSYR